LARQYGRNYRLTVTDVDGNSKEISGLHIEFEITKSTLSFPNLARISITNVSKDTLSFIQRKFNNVRLDVGYGEDIGLLFKGEIRNVFQPRNSTETYAVIYAGDGQASWQNSIFNKSFTGNISSGDAIREVIDSFNLDIGKLEGLPSAKDKIRGQTLSGASKDIMDKMAEEYGFTWSIQDGEIITTPLDTPISNFEAVVLTSSTGMINSPVITEVGADVSSLLNRNLVPNGVFQIKSESADTSLSNIFLRESIPRTSAEGFYKVQEVTHRGDSRRGDWLSNIKGITFNV